MRSIFGFRVSILMASAVLVLLILVCLLSFMKVKTETEKLRIAGLQWPGRDLFKLLDPANIEDSEQSNLIRSLFSSLMVFAQDGRLTTSIAESYRVEDDKLFFKIRTDVPIGNGRNIDEIDVVNSFKRLLLLDRNTHGKLKYFIAKGSEFVSFSQSFPAIQITENKEVVVQLKNKKLVKFFLPLLANPDFAIIPREIIDFNNPKLLISRFDLTSGPFFVSSFHADGSLEIKCKTGHFLNSGTSPKMIEYIPVLGRNLVEAYKKNTIDLIPTYHIYENREILDLYDSGRDNLWKTLNINLIYSEFTKSGLKRFNKSQRTIIGNLVKEAVLKNLAYRLELTPTAEFFGVVGESSLGKHSATLNEHKLTPSESRAIEGDLVFDSYVIDAHQKLAIVELVPGARLPKDDKEEPDVLLLSTDSGFFESLSLLSYTQSKGYFGMTDEQFYLWLDRFVDLDSPELRHLELKNMHMKLLSEAIAVPVGISPYLALARKPWMANIYNMYAGTPLWMIHKK